MSPELDEMACDEVLAAARVFVYRRCHRDSPIKVAGDRRLERSLDSTGLAGGPSSVPSAPLPLAFESRPQIATAQCTSLLSTHVDAGYTRAVAAEVSYQYLGPRADHPLQNSRSDHRLQLYSNARPGATPFRAVDSAI